MASRYEEERAAERLKEHRENTIFACSVVGYVLISVLAFAWCWQRPAYTVVPPADHQKFGHLVGSAAAGVFWPVWLVGAVAMVVTAPREG